MADDNGVVATTRIPEPGQPEYIPEVPQALSDLETLLGELEASPNPDRTIEITKGEATKIAHYSADLRRKLIVCEGIADMLGHPMPSPCGHSSQFAWSADGGKKILCLICVKEERDQMRETASTLYTALREQWGVPDDVDTLGFILKAFVIAFRDAWLQDPPANGFVSALPLPDVGMVEIEVRRSTGRSTVERLDQMKLALEAAGPFVGPCFDSDCASKDHADCAYGMLHAALEGVVIR